MSTRERPLQLAADLVENDRKSRDEFLQRVESCGRHVQERRQFTGFGPDAVAGRQQCEELVIEISAISGPLEVRVVAGFSA